MAGVIAITAPACSRAKSYDVEISRSSDAAVSSITISRVSLEDSFDLLYGVFYRDGDVFAVGERQQQMIMSSVTPEGVSGEATVMDYDSEKMGLFCSMKALGDSLIILSRRQDENGITEYIESEYNADSGQRTNVIVRKMESFYLGPVILSDKTRIYWNPEQISIYDKENVYEMEIDGEIQSVQTWGDTIYLIIKSAADVQILKADKNADFTKVHECGTSNSSDYMLFHGGGDIYYNSGGRLWAYNNEANSAQQLFLWADAGLSSADIRDCVILNQAQYACTVYDDNAVYFINSDEEDEKTTITIGVMQDSFVPIARYIGFFNGISREYRAEVKYYDSVLDLQKDLSSGNAPDVIEVSQTDIPLTNSVFLDLRPLLDADERIDVSDYYESIFDALSVDGALTSMTSSIEIQTIVGRDILLNGVNQWELSDVERLASETQSKYVFPAWATSPEMMLWVAQISIGQFVDWSLMECDFRSDEFLQWLEFCGRLPLTMDLSSLSNYSDYDTETLLTIQLVQTVPWLLQMKKNYGGEEFRLIGFPHSDGSGSFFSRPSGDMMCAIPQNAPHIDGAWQFVSGMLSPEWQEKTQNIPIMRTVLAERLQLLKEDALCPLTDKEANDFVVLMETTERFAHENSVINNIILEEAVYYFNGDRSLAEAAGIIQNRASLYLSEIE